jgi:integral membrane sensor domain MASE1
MKRVFTWPALGLGIGFVLIAAVVALISGNSSLATALFVVAALEAVFGSALVAFSRRKISRSA